MEGESDWRSSSEEADRSPDPATAADDSGMGRSYECVFCKRGFTTAQALGGHMNIHRKDRATTNKPSGRPTAAGNKADHHDDNMINNYHYYNNSSQYPSGHNSYPFHHYPTRPAAHEVNINNNSYHHHHAFFPGPMVPPAYLDLFGEDSWRRRNILPAAADLLHHHQNRSDKESGGGGDGGLDLELRLGHDRRY